MIHGPSLVTLQTAAKEAVMRHYVGIAEADGTPPTLRAMYVLKTAEARKVLSDGSSDYITKEAAMRGITPQAMATIIVQLAEQSEALELTRMEANIAIDGAQTPEDVKAVIDRIGVTVSIDL